MIDGRYIVYGVLPEEHDDNNADFESRHQKVGHTVPIYGTDDPQEAIKLVNETGGFVKEGQWYAAVWSRDTLGGGLIGQVPDEYRRQQVEGKEEK